MKKVYILGFGLMLFCNVAAIGLELYTKQSDIVCYINLAGSVLFGYYLHILKDTP